MLTFGSKINRKYSINVPFAGTYGTLNVYYHKNNSFVGIDLEHGFNKFINESDTLQYNLYVNVNESLFANLFLDIRNINCHNLDIKNQFNGIKDEWKHKIQYLTNESINLQIIKNSKEESKNFYSMLYIYMLSLEESKNDFIFIIAERQHIDKISSKKLVRSCAAQITTKEQIKYINSYKQSVTNNKITLNDIKV